MTLALNYTTKALEDFSRINETAPLGTRLGFQYLADKLRQAQVFVLPDHGELMDRSKVRPELPTNVLQPPFPIVALEYASPASTGRRTDPYHQTTSSKRIALAWRWTDDLPAEFGTWTPKDGGDGIVIASIAYVDEARCWIPMAAAAHISFDSEWLHHTKPPVVEAMVASGQMTAKQAAAKTFPMTAMPILPEALMELVRNLGADRALDTLTADVMDEVNAYVDLCYALACLNVGAELRSQPAALNKARLRSGKLPLKDFHVLKLSTGDGQGGPFGGAADRRAHLRRGHIRRLNHLGPDRVTWVNATMVKGRGFVDKAYTL